MELGLDFRHQSGARGSYLFPEMGGSGGAFLDANEDGRLDVFLVDGGSLTAAPGTLTAHGLFLQTENGRFANVSPASGVQAEGNGTGCAVGDIDNDGHLDLYIACVGRDVLLRGHGDGTFENVTTASGIRAERWSTSVAMLDYDADGWLDLYVACYVDDDRDKECRDAAGRRDFCNPAAYRPVPDVLYHNKGDGTFDDVSGQMLVDQVARRGLGVIAADLDQDGWTDLYVANDGEENFLWLNQEGKGFRELGLLGGCAVNRAGAPEASMGIAVGDVDGDLDLDLLCTHLRQESNTLYRNLGGGMFEDVTPQAGIAAITFPFTGFGTVFTDFDLDCDLDHAVVNGRVVRGTNLRKSVIDPFWDEYAEPNLLFLGDRHGAFIDACDRAGDFCAGLEVSRSLIPGDVDNDGDVDLLETVVEGRPRLYLHQVPRAHHFLEVSVVDATLRRDLLGAQVIVEAGGIKQMRDISTAVSYQCSGDSRAHFGLALVDHVDGIEVRYPGGGRERFPGCRADQHLTVRRGTGSAVR